ncbi:MAG: hypothetical protein CME19_17525 [Gemmatimonadetes bacterium]|nr:hypothetical protein [Gemmatimonadota bacterium]|tara:strand:+ start:1486 stop:1845 length:360 start_codon:yes stop_codon:yes gene_type:complete
MLISAGCVTLRPVARDLNAAERNRIEKLDQGQFIKIFLLDGKQIDMIVVAVEVREIKSIAPQTNERVGFAIGDIRAIKEGATDKSAVKKAVLAGGAIYVVALFVGLIIGAYAVGTIEFD